MVHQITPESTRRSSRNCPQSNQGISDLRTSSRTPQSCRNGNQANNNTEENLPPHFLHLDNHEQVLTTSEVNARNCQTQDNIVRSQRISDFQEAGLELRNIADNCCSDYKSHVTKETGRELRRIADELHDNVVAKDKPPDYLHFQDRRGLKRKSS